MAGRDDEGDRSESVETSHGSRKRAEKLRKAARERWGHTDSNLELISARLESSSPTKRARAAWELAEIVAESPDRSRGIPVDKKLVPLLDDDDEWVRRGASWAIATVADEHPQRAHTAFEDVTESLTDEDPLVRENSVLAVAGVAMEYPHAAESALSHLADVVRQDDGLAGRYAAEALHRIVRQLDENGFPNAITTPSELADVLPEDANVVEVTDDPTAGVQVHSRDVDDEETGVPARDGSSESFGPPDQIFSPPNVEDVTEHFEHLKSLSGNALMTAEKGRVPTAGEGGQFVVVIVRTLESEIGVDSVAVEQAFRIWANIDDHDHVVPVLGRGNTPRPWIATEFMDGGTLNFYVGSIEFERALWYAHCITTAICHAHAHGVVHGALWPGAVGLSQALDAWPVPKVDDWGFGDLLTQVQDVPVPLAYAAPEHLAPEEFGTPDSATDVYQLGALCYATFTGRPPHTGEGRELAKKICRKSPPDPTDVVPALPTELDDLLGRALTKEKRARFETAEDFRRELELLVGKYGSEDWL